MNHGTPIETLAELGARFAEARRASGLTQAELAQELGLDRTAITRIETGQRGVDAIELARIARALGRSIDWFLIPPPPAVISRRAEREGSVEGPAELELERLARDAALLIELGALLPAEAPRLPFTIQSPEEAERAAAFVREQLSQPEAPLADLVVVADALGMFVVTLRLPVPFDGSYVALDPGGVALINGTAPSGRRRFTIAHELGHHLFADAYSPEWVIGDTPRDRERLINAFAIHLLLPRAAVQRVWGDTGDPRRAALTLGARFGVSWSAVCGHLCNLRLIDERQRALLIDHPPMKADYLEMDLQVMEEPEPPLLSPRLSGAVVRAYRKNKISRERALELLRGTITEEELPAQGELPVEAMLAELAPLGLGSPDHP